MDKEQKASGRRFWWQILRWGGIGAAVLPLLVVISWIYDADLWDWLDLLVVPAAPAIGEFLLNRAQKERELRIEAARLEREQADTNNGRKMRHYKHTWIRCRNS